MKTIIAGTRDINDYDTVIKAVNDSGFMISEVVCGMAPGADMLGKQWALEHNIPVAKFPADWKKYKNAAGPIRNAEMANYGDALIAIWDGKSKGTANMIKLARNKNLKVFVYMVN